MKTNQQGIVSIFVVMIMMLIISLIVIGFSQVARRNQRESLDRQLATQAYYAAESGVNAAVGYFKNPINSSKPIDTTADCNEFTTSASYLGGASTNLSPDGTVKWSCLTVNSKPPELQTAPLEQDANLVWHLKSVDAAGNSAPFGSLKVSWGDDDNYNTAASPKPDKCFKLNPGTIPAATDADWPCGYGMLRVDIMPAAFTHDSAEADISGVRSFYFYPNTGGLTADLASPNTGIVSQASAACSAADGCSALINNVTGNEYYARFTIYYRNASFVKVEDGVTASGIRFVDGQAVIDATGIAKDQTKRIQARIPLVLNNSSDVPSFGAQTTNSICKQLTVYNSIYDKGVCDVN